MRNRVLLYSPREKTKLRVPYLPFSLLTVASALIENGFSVDIVDGRVEDHPHEALTSRLGEDLLFIGITLMTGSVIFDAVRVMADLKKKCPDVPIILGGVHPSLLAEETAQYPNVDCVVVGPGERTAVRIAQSLNAGRGMDGIPGTVRQANGRIISVPQDPVTDPKAFVPIRYDLIPLDRYFKKDSTGKRCLDYISSRGCPHPCAFCAISKVWHGKIFFYPAEKMVEDIRFFSERYGIDAVHFLDDNFFVDAQRVEKFCDAMIERGSALKFWATCRIQYLVKYQDAFLEKLARAGFRTLNFGAESGSAEVLSRIKKGHVPEEIVLAAKICKRWGFRGQFSFMMGLPFETEEDLRKTMELMDTLHSISPDFDLQLFPFIPFPKTELALECQRLGHHPPTDLESWGRFEFGWIKMPWLSAPLKKKIDTLTTIAWFAFTSETAIKLGGWKGRVYRWLGRWARIRWKRRFFSFPVEWKLINLLGRM